MKMKDLIRRDSARRIIESPRSKKQMLAILRSLPSEDNITIQNGVLVKGWSIPDGCISCPFFSGQGCKVTMRLFSDWVNVATRPDGCPLSEYNAPTNYVVSDPNEENSDELIK